MSAFLAANNFTESSVFSFRIRLNTLRLVNVFFLSILLNCAFAGKNIDKAIIISGDITIQALGEEKAVRASNSKITLCLGDSVCDTIAVTKSGLFVFRLRVGHDYTLRCEKSGYATKYINFLLKDVDSNLIDKSNNTFDLSVNLIASDFLTENVITRTDESEVYWDYRYNGLSFSNRELQRKWSIIDSLSREFHKAVNNLPPKHLYDQIASLPDSVNWPNGIGSSFDIAVIGNYPLYVGLVLENKSNPQSLKTNLSYSNSARLLSNRNVNLLVLNDQSLFENADLNSYKDGDVLLVSASENSNAMIQLSSESSQNIYVANEVDFENRGFSLVRTSGMLADNTSLEEHDQGSTSIAGDSANVNDLIMAVKSQETALQLKRIALRRVQKSFDSIASVKNWALAELGREISDAENRLANLNQEILEKASLANAMIPESDSEVLAQTNAEAENAKEYVESALVNEDFVGLTDEIEAEQHRWFESQSGSEKTGLFLGLMISMVVVLLSVFYKTYNSGQKNKMLKGDIGYKAKKLLLQRTQLEQKNKEMSDSINYAKRIQMAMLPQMRTIQEHFNQSFVMYQPKDVVAGDFFWMKELNGLIYFAVADCTGHGVPGAMMSVLCHGALDRAIRESKNPNPSDVLALTRKFVIEQIAIGEGHVMDGMDIALCAYNKETRELQFSGAQNPLWIASERLIEHPNVRSDKFEFGAGYLNEIKGDKQPVGEFYASSAFTNHSIFLDEGDTIYIFSDGFPDQFGGRRGKKLKNSLFKELIGLIQDQNDLEKQKEFLSEYFINWKGDLEQVDDVCIMGIRF